MGICCIEGDTGAPLETEEISLLQDSVASIQPYMTENGIKCVEDTGIFDYDEKGNYVTPLVNGAACTFCNFKNGVAVCAIELAFDNGDITFQKPISCHLYPLRINRSGTFEKITFHRWNICRSAIQNGEKKKIPLVIFLKDALIRKFGEIWYNDLIDLCKLNLFFPYK